jgi:hypothetical protein
MSRSIVRPLVGVCCVCALLTVFAVAQKGPVLQVFKEVKHDLSPPLAELQRMTPMRPINFSPRMLKVLPLPPVDRGTTQASAPDVALQEKILGPVSAPLGLNFEGLGKGEYGFTIFSAPPDTNGNVGDTQYVQWVNTDFAVFDKTTGALLSGPQPGNSLWAGFGGGCETNNDGDPIVQYDKLAKRWIFTQFSVSTTPFMQCVAVSTTSDATGSYHRYAFSFGIQFPDYPKLGVWPDAYYMSFNNFLNGGPFSGADACALQRSAMLAGTTAKIVCFQQTTAVGGLLPSDLDGSILPAAGEPGFFMNFGSNSLNLWKFHVDFGTPANSTFTGPTNLAVSSFTSMCNGGTCVTQPFPNKLDSLADRLMYRLAYRKFSDGHESLVVNHSIKVGTTGGVRWYEIQNPNGTPTVFQQGTFAPDAAFRWMGSIAMDQAGDIALGYSKSSASVFPSVYFTGRVPSDAAGSMETEQLVVAGTGSQTGGLTRWGDYSAMTIDPSDDCTFYYTQEYIKANGSFNWNTRIATFKFPGCGSTGGSPAVTLSATTLSFRKTPIGQTSPAKSITLTNTGSGTLHFTNIGITGDFAISSNTCGTQVSAGGSCVVTMTFSPTAKGARKGTLSFNDDAAGSPQTVALSGTGMSIAVTPATFDYGTVTVGSSSNHTFTVSNVSSAAVSLTGFTLTGAQAADYTINSNTCGASLAAGGHCSIVVKFAPSVTGKRSATLNVANNGGGSPSPATLTGTGG